MSTDSLIENISSILLKQDFLAENETEYLEGLILSLKEYIKIENCVAVLSDFKSDISYIFSGSFGRVFKITDSYQKIDSAFEKFIFDQIHPDDFAERHHLEMDYINYLKQINLNERTNYITSCTFRTRTDEGDYQYINHQMRYIRHMENGAMWLALCLYTPSSNQKTFTGIQGKIFNNISGETVHNLSKSDEVLTQRETEILTLISQGFLSKQIAAHLEISVNTVNRHRQNIIRKMKVSHIAEAIKITVSS